MADRDPRVLCQGLREQKTYGQIGEEEKKGNNSWDLNVV